MKTNKKELTVFALCAYAIPFLMMPLLYICLQNGRDTSIFANAQMFYPAAGVMLAFLLAVVSVILFAPVFLEYLNTGLVPRFPTLIACGFILLAGIQSFFSGMMLEVMAAKDRKDFEYRLNRVHGEHQERKGL